LCHPKGLKYPFELVLGPFELVLGKSFYIFLNTQAAYHYIKKSKVYIKGKPKKKTGRGQGT
jgi:hypothetical protein